MITDIVKNEEIDALLAQARRVETIYEGHKKYLSVRRLEEERTRGGYSDSAIIRKKIKETIDEVGPFTADTLFIGVAEDGLPILLNLEDPTPGAMLFVGDRQTGKMPQLKTIAAALEFTHKPEQIRFAVLTDNRAHWQDVVDSPNIINIFSFYQQNVTAAFLEGLVNWTNVNRQGDQALVLLIENVDKLFYLPREAQANLRWLCKHGAENKVWVIASIETGAFYENPERWENWFETLVYGQINRDRHRMIDEYVPVEIQSRGEFVFVEGNNRFVRFHTPLLSV